MPSPLSPTHRIEGFDDIGQLTHPSFAPAWQSTNNTAQRPPDTTLLRGKNFLDRFKQNVTSNVPIPNNLFSTSVSNPDEDQGLSIGPKGIVASGRGELDNDLPRWQLELNPWIGSGSFSAGDFKIGGSSGVSPSAFVSKGPVRFDVGYGAAPVFSPEGFRPAKSQPSKWAKLSVDIQPERGVQTPAEITVSRAFETDEMRPYAATPNYDRVETAREAAEKLVSDYRAENPYWYRP